MLHIPNGHVVRALSIAWLGAACAACDPVVGAPEDVERDIIALRFDGACAGFKAEDPEVRAYTAERLVTFADQAEANTCLCAALYDPSTGAVDPIVAQKVAKSKRDDLAKCLLPALTDVRVADHAGAVGLLAAIGAPSGFETLGTLAAQGAEAPVRVAAIDGLGLTTGYDHVLVGALTGDAAPEVRVAAAKALFAHKDQSAIVALGAAMKSDDAALREAAAGSLASMESVDGDNFACGALMDDPIDSVRAAPLVVWQRMQARRIEVSTCLGKKLGDPEPSEPIRGVVIALLKSAATVEAKNALCDGIGPYTRANVADKVPEEGSAGDLITVQNTLDWDRSYACVQKALAQGGYTCEGKYWLSWWAVRLGGHASAAKCPGMAADAEDIKSSGPHEVSFE